MTNIKLIEGNIFTSKCQTLVNTVNCSGVMGAGIALECRLRFPEMYSKYVLYCTEGRIDIGTLWLYKSKERWVLNFPTKKDWRLPSKEDYLHAGLKKFMNTYEAKGISSIAFPVLGAQNGGLDIFKSIEIMKLYLCKCKIPVEIYKYNSSAPDDLYEKFKISFISTPIDQLKSNTGLKINQIAIIRNALENSNIHQLNQLNKINGIGIKTLEKAFLYMHRKFTEDFSPKQQSF